MVFLLDSRDPWRLIRPLVTDAFGGAVAFAFTKYTGWKVDMVVGADPSSELAVLVSDSGLMCGLCCSSESGLCEYSFCLRSQA